MKVVVQRCEKASVSVDDKLINAIENGLMILVGFTEGDTEKEIDYMVKKVANLRIFDDENGIMNKSVLDIKGSILSISQFTLYGDASKGNRPSYIKALNGEKATKLYDLFNEKLNELAPTKTGVFGAEMKIDFINDGPITIILEK
ncbi:MAG: D-tyrosyl-tRNA(Tyr) deacylase [Bacilli bacterium]|nr:D-tyrosyl-tRNA(Tyr) deacylase [Bacilli bacterium]